MNLQVTCDMLKINSNDIYIGIFSYFIKHYFFIYLFVCLHCYCETRIALLNIIEIYVIVQVPIKVIEFYI